MTKVIGKNIDLHVENFLANNANSEAMLKPVAELVQWIKENCGDQLGDIKYSALTEAQFASLKGYDIVDGSGSPIPESQKKWVLHKGQSIVGSDYSVFSGKNSLPNLVGNEAHLAQALNDASLLSYQANQNKTHTHQVTYMKGFSLDEEYASVFPDMSVDRTYETQGGVTKTTTSEGGAVARPNRAMVNIFIKINN